MNIAPPEDFFSSLDDLVNVEFKAKLPLLGGTRIRYTATRAAAGEPTVLQAARLLNGVDKGTVFITTGAGNPVTLPAGETDGPSGAAFIARALVLQGHRIVLLSDKAFMPGIVASFRALGLSVSRDGDEDTIHVVDFPLGGEAGQDMVERLLDTYPDAVAGVFIEKPGPNNRGVFHTSSGKPKDANSVAHLHLLAEALRVAGKVTVGVGDGGNEIGFGRVGRSLEADLPLAKNCGCGCGGGIVNATEVDSLVSASTSNWGAYGVLTAMAILSSREDLLPSVEAVRATIEASVAKGANDGYSGENVSTVDGVGLAANEAIYALCLEARRQAGGLK